MSTDPRSNQKPLWSAYPPWKTDEEREEIDDALP
jgi:hypothetical protein